jgi:hypothetical protein
MKHTHYLKTLSFLVLTSCLILSFDMPKKWFAAGSEPDSYKMGTDKAAGQDGKNAATIQSKKKNINGFGTMMQNCLPDKYLGKRVRMSGYLKTEDVADWSGFWFRIDQTGSDKTLGFDNMHNGKEDRAVKGTTDWKKYEIVLDVPMKASNLAYGALLVGTGKIWFDKIAFEVVDKSVPTTGANENELMPNEEPVNLDFEY